MDDEIRGNSQAVSSTVIERKNQPPTEHKKIVEKLITDII